MLSNDKKISKLEERKRLLSLPPLERPITVRLKFRKVGSLQYISHLDLQRTLSYAHGFPYGIQRALILTQSWSFLRR